MLRFHHVNLAVLPGRLDEEIEFLVDGLGMTSIDAGPELTARGACWFEFEDGVQVHLSQDPDHRPAGRAHVALDLGDQLEAIGRRLGELGVQSTMSSDRPDPVLNCVDPAGNRWELRGELAAS